MPDPAPTQEPGKSEEPKKSEEAKKSEGKKAEDPTTGKSVQTNTGTPAPTPQPPPPMTGVDFIPILMLMLLAGALGGIVNTALGKKEDDTVSAPLKQNVTIGIGAAFLVPLFLKSVDSKILDTLHLDAMNKLLLFSYCTLASISARHFITSLTEQVFKKIDTLKQDAESTKKELDKTKQEVEKAKSASQAAKNVALAATDAARLQTVALVNAGPVRTKPATLKLTPEEYDTALKQEDPWKGRFGSSAEQKSRKLEGKLDRVDGQPTIAVISLTVMSTDPTKPLTGKVQFFLHPTYQNYLPEIAVQEGKATLNLMSYGAFTVGVQCDEGATSLELDLAQLPDAWEPWKSR